MLNITQKHQQASAMQVQQWPHGRTHGRQKLCFQRVVEATTDVTAVKHVLPHMEEGSQELSFSHLVVLAKLTWSPLLGIPCQGPLEHSPALELVHGGGRSSTKADKWKQVQFTMATSKNWVSCRM